MTAHAIAGSTGAQFASGQHCCREAAPARKCTLALGELAGIFRRLSGLPYSGSCLMMRATIYARYSSDQQRSASIEDQVRLCRERIEREGWSLVATHSDAAMSGASRLRPGYQKLWRMPGAAISTWSWPRRSTA